MTDPTPPLPESAQTLDVDSPAPSEQQSTRRQRKPKRRISAVLASVLVIGALLLAGGGLYFLVWAEGQKAAASEQLDSSNQALEQQKQKAAEEKRTKDAAAAKARRLKDEEARFASAGYMAAGNGLYFKWAQDGEFTCGYLNCAAVYVSTGAKACPTGVYLEANIMSGNMAIGMTNDTIGGLAANSAGALMLEDYTRSGDSFQMTELKCF